MNGEDKVNGFRSMQTEDGGNCNEALLASEQGTVVSEVKDPQIQEEAGNGVGANDVTEAQIHEEVGFDSGANCVGGSQSHDVDGHGADAINDKKSEIHEETEVTAVVSDVEEALIDEVSEERDAGASKVKESEICNIDDFEIKKHAEGAAGATDVKQSRIHEEAPRPRMNNKKQRTSMELRRLPIDVLLNPDCGPDSSVGDSEDEEEETPQGSRSLLQMTCLNPNLSLHTQLVLSFGSVSVIMIGFVLLLCVLIVLSSGKNVKSINKENFEDLVFDIEAKFARYIAESLTPTLIPYEAQRMLYMSARERFAGYPNEGDDFVPFYDTESQTNMYPIVGAAGKSVPLDWDIEANVNDDNHEEHVQDRWSWYDSEPALSTSNAFFHMPGVCDPSVTDPSAFTFWENCTEANNDISTGGIIIPSPTNNQIYRKASSLAPMLKTIYEINRFSHDMGIYFANSGAGAVVGFPHFPLRTNTTYTSIGCEWMNNPNPYDNSRKIGTKEEIARCRPNGTIVSSRVYNPMERGWCRDQALNPFGIVNDGPFVNAWNEGQLVMGGGQAIYDPFTNNFVGCTWLGWILDDTIKKFLVSSKVTMNSEVSMARFDDGTTVASTAWNSLTATETIKIYELDVGLSVEDHEQLKGLVDYDEKWDAKEVREKYETFILSRDGFLVSIYPMPPVPESYDPIYKPVFFAMLSAAEEDIFQVVDKVEKEVDEQVDRLIIISLIVGASGIVAVLLSIYLISKLLTAPLKYMTTTADAIMNNFGSSKAPKTTIENPHTSGFRAWIPKTEADEVLKEFNKMVKSFSGSFASKAKTVKRRNEEVMNQFEMREAFKELYESRKNDDFRYKLDNAGTEGANMTDFLHLGSNVGIIEGTVCTSRKSSVATFKKTSFTSRLFIFTVVLIGTPFLISAIAISAIVMYSMAKNFDSALESAEKVYLEVELTALSAYSTLRADVVSSGTSRATRDLFILTRYANWLVFGGLERAASFTEIKTGIEQCKNFSDIAECPSYERFCDCAWNEPGQTCNNYTYDTRHFQDLFFIGQSSDAFPNGDRNSTTFPKHSYSPESTFWWEDIKSLPGSEKGDLASAYDTTYDRIRVMSASPVHQLVYNQDVKKEYTIANYIGFEADGTFLGFVGCQVEDIFGSHGWSSTEANGAYKLRPELCPLGKYGYDPRCRGWYDTGKKLSEKDGNPLHVTPPYVYSTNIIGQSATSPLIDPQTNEHIGQVLIDFVSGPIFESLDAKNTPLRDGGFPFLITTVAGADSVVAPGYAADKKSARPISELVLSNDHDCDAAECVQRRNEFDQIVSAMKNGNSSLTNFTRKSATGSVETIHVAYAPVLLKGYRPVNSSDFSRGLESRDIVVYSLALAENEDDLLESFQQIEEETNKQIRVAIIILSVIIVFSLGCFVYFSYVIARSLTIPMVFLLDVIRSINRLNVDEEPPLVDRSVGSRELICVSETVQTLYRVVRCGNYAFFSGDLEKAYVVLSDALQLFKSLDNKKAVGVVSNNLGNLVLVMYRTMEEAGEELSCGMTKKEMISKGTSYFHEAIQLGEKAYDKFHEIEGWSPNCLDFMQHLSNRYFNRAIFLLAVKDGHEQPDELERLGLRDLEIARDLDMEIMDSGAEAGWGDADRVEKLLDVSQVRSRGHLLLLEMGFPDTWEIGESLDESFELLKKEIKKDNSPLFLNTTAIGRLQAIEAELLKYRLLKGETKLAAQISTRMLFEDEFIFPEAHAKAIEALSKYAGSMEMNEDALQKVKRGLALCEASLNGVIDDMDRTRKSMPSEDSREISSLTAARRAIASTRALSTCSTTMSQVLSVRETRRGYITMEEI